LTAHDPRYATHRSRRIAVPYDLLARDGVGAPAGKGSDRRPHLAGAIVAGQNVRGGRRASIDLELGFPGGNILMILGSAGRPVLAPLALRTTALAYRRARRAPRRRGRHRHSGRSHIMSTPSSGVSWVGQGFGIGAIQYGVSGSGVVVKRAFTR